MITSGTKWKDHEESTLAVMYKNGHSIDDINAAIPTRDIGAIKTRIKKMKLKRAEFKPVYKVTSRPVKKYVPIEVPDNAIHLSDLKDDQCHYPYDGMMYCGAQSIKPRGYCDGHHKACYTRSCASSS